MELAVFPEGYVGGYPKGLDFGARIGSRTAAGRDDFLRYWQSAIDVPGPETARIGAFAARMNAHLVVGVIERGGATLYCTALFFGPDGALLGKHRKLVPTASERLVWGQGDGSTITVLDTSIGKIGAAICWENYMPNLRQAMYGKGINLWCAPTVDERDIWQSSMRHIAYEGRTFVLSACQYFTRADAPDSYVCVQGDDPATVLIRGGSVIVGPLGNVLGGPLYDREAVVTADIDLSDAIRGCTLIEDLAPLFVEDPVRAEGFNDDLPQLRRLVRVPIAAGEEWGNRWDFNPLVERHEIDYVRATLPNVGGITEMLKIAAMCETHFVGIVPHFTGPIATAALVNTLGTFSGPVLMEYNFQGRTLPHLPVCLDFKDGKLYPNERPGLGVELDMKQLRQITEITQPVTARAQTYFRPDGSITNW